MSQASPSVAKAFTLGDWSVEPDRNCLSRDGRSTTVENKSMDVLVLLASRAGDVLSNDEIIDAVWNGRPMGENPIYKCVANLRSALGDDRKSPKYIETIPRKGYRLVAKVSPAIGSHAGSSERRHTVRNASIAAVALLVAAVVFVSLRSDMPGKTQISRDVPENSIAVLPFQNLSIDPDNDFFCDGIAEELLNRLAEMPELRVVARHSSFSLGDQVEDLPDFARRLGVHYLLSGSVRQSGDLIRVNARLLDFDGTLIWSESYDRSPDNIAALQDEVANAVASGLALKTGYTFLKKPAQTQSFDAYSSNLHGNELMNRRTPGWGPLAIAAFRDAIRLDPNFAAPYAGLAAANLLSKRENPVAMRDADAAIEVALRLNPNLAEAHAAAGLSSMFKGSTGDYRNAEVSLRRALRLNSSLVNARSWLSTTLSVLGQKEEAMQVLEDALSIDPLNPILNMNLGRRYHADGRLDAAREQMVSALPYPDTPSYVRTWIAEVEKDAGRLDTALSGMKQAYNASLFDDDKNRWYASAVASMYAELGMFDEANVWLAASRLPVESHWRLAAFYNVLAPQRDRESLDEEIRAHEATVTAERPLTLNSRSLIGRHAVQVGDYGRGAQYLGSIFSEGWILRNAPGGSNELFTTLQYYAVALQRTGQGEKAKLLLEKALEKQVEWRRGRTRILGQILAQEAVTYLLLGESDVALARFKEAVAADWRYYYSVQGNPCWDGLRGDPTFQSLLSQVKQDVDVQRERVMAEERSQPFIPPET